MESSQKTLNIAIVGLGPKSCIFLNELADRKAHRIAIAAAADKDEGAPGVKVATEKGIKVYRDGLEIVKMGSAVDIIFDLSECPHDKMRLRVALARSGNLHTIISNDTLTTLVANLISTSDDLAALSA